MSMFSVTFLKRLERKSTIFISSFTFPRSKSLTVLRPVPNIYTVYKSQLSTRHYTVHFFKGQTQQNCMCDRPRGVCLGSDLRDGRWFYIFEK